MKVFFDTNILVYLFDAGAPASGGRHAISPLLPNIPPHARSPPFPRQKG